MVLAQTLQSIEIPNYHVRKVLPKDYKLFQDADMICTLTLMEKKIEDGILSRSELLLFHNVKDLKKQFLIPLKRKEFSYNK